MDTAAAVPPPVDETRGITRQGSTLTRIYAVGADTVRVRIERDFYPFQSFAGVEILTTDRRWTTLITDPISNWHPATCLDPPDIVAALDQLADRLINRTAAILGWTSATRRAETARAIAAALCVPRHHVRVDNDPDRPSPDCRTPGDLIIITSTAQHEDRYIPIPDDDSVWLLLGICLECGGTVPVARVAAQPDPNTGEVVDCSSEVSYDDPGHRPGCLHRPLSEATTPAPQPATDEHG